MQDTRPQAVQHAEALYQRAAVRSIRAQRIGMQARRMGLSYARLLSLTQKRRAEEQAQKDAMRAAWKAAGLCERCGDEMVRESALCRDCWENMS